ncbi:hypothetical protein G3I20_11030 [Streptomyces sp. SID8111]|uniref:hypothetical protein n=1 Tax=Streptomyces sp. SID8111 TaxID=2706100 RepID=UPI0013BFD34B|nr:hypothetical protein [Streptomyces sp. SID8111]NEB60167.1 hypothetical protein [Streptomyces diastaticus]NEC27078.1 hypothetical protein [Streptomyces sp. SID8111]
MQTARAYGRALAEHHSRTHASTARTATGRIYYYDHLTAYGAPFCTPVYTVDAVLPVCDETGCNCSRAAALQAVANRQRPWQTRPDADRITHERTHVNVIFEGPNGPPSEHRN